jgi:hypothetical protein
LDSEYCLQPGPHKLSPHGKRKHMPVNPIDTVLKTHKLESQENLPSRYILLRLKEDENKNVMVDLITEGIRDDAGVVTRILENVAESIRNESVVS